MYPKHLLAHIQEYFASVNRNIKASYNFVMFAEKTNFAEIQLAKI